MFNKSKFNLGLIQYLEEIYVFKTENESGVIYTLPNGSDIMISNSNDTRLQGISPVDAIIDDIEYLRIEATMKGRRLGKTSR